MYTAIVFIDISDHSSEFQLKEKYFQKCFDVKIVCRFLESILLIFNWRSPVISFVKNSTDFKLTEKY